MKSKKIFSEEYDIKDETKDSSVDNDDILDLENGEDEFQKDHFKPEISKPKRIVIRAKILDD